MRWLYLRPSSGDTLYAAEVPEVHWGSVAVVRTAAQFVGYRGRVPMSWCRCRYTAVGLLRYSRGPYHRCHGIVCRGTGVGHGLSGTVVGYQCRGVSVVIRSLGRCDTVLVATTPYILSSMPTVEACCM